MAIVVKPPRDALQAAFGNLRTVTAIEGLFDSAESLETLKQEIALPDNVRRVREVGDLGPARDGYITPSSDVVYSLDRPISVGYNSITPPPGGLYLTVEPLGFLAPFPPLFSPPLLGFTAPFVSVRNLGGGPLFAAPPGEKSGSVFLHGLHLEKPDGGAIFSLDSAADSVLSLSSCAFFGSFSLGSVSGTHGVAFSNVLFNGLQDGLTLNGSISRLSLWRCAAGDMPSGFALLKRGVATEIERADINIDFLNSSPTSAVFDLRPEDIAANGLARVEGGEIPASAVASLPATSERVLYRDNTGTTNSAPGFDYSYDVDSSVAFLSAGAEALVSSGRDVRRAVWFDMSAAGSSVFLGRGKALFRCSLSLSMSGTLNDVIGVTVKRYESGGASPSETIAAPDATLTSGPTGLSYSFTAELTPGGRLELYLTNKTGSGSVILKAKSRFHIESIVI